MIFILSKIISIDLNNIDLPFRLQELDGYFYFEVPKVIISTMEVVIGGTEKRIKQ